MIVRDLFGTVPLVRHWGSRGVMQGHELAQDFPAEEAVAVLERLAAARMLPDSPAAAVASSSIASTCEKPRAVMANRRGD